jgi:hypothetical protein
VKTPEPTITLAPARFVTIDLAATLTELTAKAIRRKLGDAALLRTFIVARYKYGRPL